MAVKLSTHAVKVLGGKAPDNIQAPDLPPGPPEQVEPPDPEPADADGITRRFMDSKVLGGIVPLSWTETGDKVWVDSVCYLGHEIQELMARNVDAATLRAVHETKRAFDGTLN